MAEYGIILKGERPIDEGQFKYDSRKQKMQIDLADPAGHARIIEMDGGTIVTQAAGGTTNLTETLYTFKHNMPFRPQVLSYYYVRDVPGDRQSGVTIGSYASDTLPVIFNAVGYGS